MKKDEELDDIISKTKELKVLFVSRDDIEKLSTLKILNQFFNNIVTVTTAEEGIEIFTNCSDIVQYDIVISEVQLPKMSGLDLAKKIRNINYSIPILFYKFSNDIDNFIDIIDLRIIGCLSMPLDLDKLMFYLKRIIDSIESRNIQNYKQKNILDTLDKNVIFTKTDLDGNITHSSEAFCKISGYSKDELIGKSHNIIRHPDMPMETFLYLWSVIPTCKRWVGDIKNLNKDGTHYWLNTTIDPEYDYDGNHIGYISIRKDIADQKEVEILNTSLEMKIEDRTKKLNIAKKEAELIMKSILIPVLITSVKTRKIVYANKYALSQYEITHDEIIGMNIDQLYSIDGQNLNLINQMKTVGYIDNVEETFQTCTGKKFIAVLSVVPIRYNNEDCYIGMVTDITKQKNAEAEVRAIQKNTRDSIEYASLIQSALIPDNKLFTEYFNDYFVIWEPKDTVGGDIYLFETLRDENECLLMYIDCTGHGVPGAFVTMLIKAVERQIITEIINTPDMNVSTASIMSYFNKTLKMLLKQESINSISNSGFDGGIIYYNKKDKILKFSGAHTALNYKDINNDFQTIKGDRYSVGYKRCDSNYQYKETILAVEDGMKFYCTTDGYLDQNGGNKNFPFGKTRFKNIVEEFSNESMSDQKEVFLYKMDEYENMEKNNDRNDDITVIGFTI